MFAGEPTLKVKGNGFGGRNKHLALIAADSFTSMNASIIHLDMEQYLNNCDSYNFFRQEGGLIITGPTQTNVMDLMIALIN